MFKSNLDLWLLMVRAAVSLNLFDHSLSFAISCLKLVDDRDKHDRPRVHHVLPPIGKLQHSKLSQAR